MFKKMADLLIKLKNMYSKDLYIVKNKYIVSGDESSDHIHTNSVTIVEPQYVEVLSSFFSENDLIYIPSVDAFKKRMQEEGSVDGFYTVIEDRLDISEFIQKILGAVDKLEWFPITIHDGFVDTIFNKKSNYEIKYEDYIIQIGKPALPLITEKTIDKLYHNITYKDDLGLLEMCIKFNHTHFQYYIIYDVIPIKHN